MENQSLINPPKKQENSAVLLDGAVQYFCLTNKKIMVNSYTKVGYTASPILDDQNGKRLKIIPAIKTA